MPKRNMTLIGVLERITFYLLVILLWEFVYKLGVDVFHIWKSYIFPSPGSVSLTLWQMIKNNTLAIAVLASMRRILVGYSLSLILGVTIGFILVKFEYLNRNLRPLILGLQTLPSICWLPFAILWFGLNESSILFVIIIGSTFAIAMATESGIENINPLYIRAARTMGAKGANIYTNVIIPASLPSFINGMKQGWSFAWRALMAGEMLSATVGLGQVLMVGRDMADISQVMAVMIVIVILGLVVDNLVFGRLEISVRKKWGLERAA